MIKPLEITFYIEPDKLEGFVMDIRDASMNPKDKNDWHRLLADSAEDQAERQNRECECTDCSCVKEEFKLPEHLELIENTAMKPEYVITFKSEKEPVHIASSDMTGFSLSENTQSIS